MKPHFTLLYLLCPAVLILALFLAGCSAEDPGICGYCGYNSETQNYTQNQEWIDAYGSTPWYQSDAREFVELVEYFMEGANDELRARMEQAFTTAFGYEYMFWDRGDAAPLHDTWRETHISRP